MSCNHCIKGNYDFFTREIDDQAFLYQDLSTWQSGNNYCVPDEYSIEVYPPGCTDPVFIEMSVNNINKVTADVLNPVGSPGKIQDGVYYFAVGQNTDGYCGIEMRRSVAIIPGLQCCFDKAFMKYALFRKEDIKHLEFLIRSVRLNALVGNIQASNDYYDMARSALKRMDCDCSL